MVSDTMSALVKGRNRKRFAKLFLAGPRVTLVSAIACALFLVLAVRNFVSLEELGKPEEHFASLPVGSRADWKRGTDLPEFCKALIRNPVPWDRECIHDRSTIDCANGTRYQMFSRSQQDSFLYSSHFMHLKRPGFYLDIAANDPVLTSNSFFMDRCLGWHGICVEANPEYHEMLYRDRSCHLVPTCVSNEDGQVVKFGLRGVHGGIVGDTFKHNGNERIRVTEVSARCTTMKTVLERNAVSVVDYLSLDVEGHELEVLKGFDWDNLVVNVMTIEVSREAAKVIEDFLTPKGYKRLAVNYDGKGERRTFLAEDMVMLHETVEFGNPR